MKNRIFRGMAAALALALLSGAALAEVRTTGDVWLRTGPGLSYDTITSVGEGKTLDYLGESSVDDRGVAWYKVSISGKTGWISSRYSELIGEDADPEPAPPVHIDDESDAQPEPTAEPTATPPVTLPAPDAGILFENDAPEADAPAEAPVSAPQRAVELSGYYLNNLVEAANDIGLISYRQVESEVPYQYYNSAVILAGNQQVENIVVYGEGYEVYGVTVGMDAAAARACLNAAGLDYIASMNGFTYGHRATEASRFTDEHGHDSCINVWVDENDVVTEIDWSTYTG